MKVALFDFCDTIANFQTADAYVYYVLQHRNNSKVAKRGIVFKLFNKLIIISILGILFPHASINKRMVLSLLKGIRKEQLDRLAEAYYNDIIRTNLITEVIDIDILIVTHFQIRVTDDDIQRIRIVLHWLNLADVRLFGRTAIT